MKLGLISGYSGARMSIPIDAIKHAESLGYESIWTAEAYGSDAFGQGCLLARRLIEHDVRAVEVSFGGWDMHNSVFINAPDKCKILDQALGALLSDLEKRGKLQDTVVVLTTEFGRTPRINQKTDRWSYYSIRPDSAAVSTVKLRRV